MRAAFEKHSPLIAAVLTVITLLLGFLLASSTQAANDAGQRVDALEPQVARVEETNDDLNTALSRSGGRQARTSGQS